MFGIINDVLFHCSLPLNQCIGQAYDGAANMSGIMNGAQALLNSQANRALYVHCLEHSLNLCLQSITKICDFIQYALNIIHELVQLIKYSPNAFLRKVIVVNTGEVQSPSLKTLCPTGWTIRHCSINSVVVNYKIILGSLEEVRQVTDKYAAEARGFLAWVEYFVLYIALFLPCLIFLS